MRQKPVPKRPAPAAATLRARIDRALASGAIETAARLAETALAGGAGDPMLLNLAAWRREEAGDYAGAHQLLQRALALVPGDPLVLAAIAAVLRKEGRADDALVIIDRSIATVPHHAPFWLERGYIHDALRNWAAARASYERALSLDPALAPAMAKLADLAAKDGDPIAGRRMALAALALDPAEPTAVCALATIEIEARDGAAAQQRLIALLDRSGKGVKGEDRIRALTLLGDALDRQDRTADAFATWTRAQQAFRDLHRTDLAPADGRPSHRMFIRAIADQVRASPPMAPPPPPPPVPGAAATHVFLLGYPRSGTTLVENVLASAPGVVALEERDTLADADGVLIANDGTMPALDAIDADRLAALRAAYWRRVAALAGDVDGRTFVDMNPFNGIKLPLIARLFPTARILVMRRDPRDVVLSCFRINFTPSTAAWAFSELEETARHYDALMTLTELCRERLPLACHEVRYDRLVTDFEATVRAVADFVGLEWTDAFLRFDRTAQARGVRTASAGQVRRGLFDGRGQWRRYADPLAPALPILAPWIERFGFDT
ncbi:tetratricopeptide repeat-containing sulfotransferase family protein [Sphingomonas montana]|uniref:tetratricopeptide repeat-containing sulfotransferase family protein n=1 Tax=Sphingomonas montana TaxID=1843236 RepID=UPI0013EE240E|nr:tetratricopeptide repeat-containing sulfotransferase family protein [Sphingomonas montana]